MYHIVIPARFGSTRLPGKALADIAGHPMVYWVWKRAMECHADSVIVATDNPEIARVMQGYGAEVAMTRTDHPSGTDRLAEVADQYAWDDQTVVVNLQGDEPLMPKENLTQVARELINHSDASIATLSESLSSVEELNNPAIVKVVTNGFGEAMYFSRAPIPYLRSPDDTSAALQLTTAQRHIGLYAYRCGFLRQYVRWQPAVTERLESLEQLRALHYGHRIRVQPAARPVPAGVDTAEDLELVRRLMGS